MLSYLFRFIAIDILNAVYTSKIFPEKNNIFEKGELEAYIRLEMSVCQSTGYMTAAMLMAYYYYFGLMSLRSTFILRPNDPSKPSMLGSYLLGSEVKDSIMVRHGSSTVLKGTSFFHRMRGIFG